MDIEIVDICEKGETVTIAFSGTVWYANLTFTMADMRKLAELLKIGYSDLEKKLVHKESVKELLSQVKKAKKP
jgi:(2Fe-2S) ferredoxin